MSLRTDLGEAAVQYVRLHAASIDEIAEHLILTFAERLENEGDRAIRAFVRQAAKEGLADRTDDHRQATLPGFHVPATITVPLDEGGRIVYVASVAATQDEWRAHRAMKEANIRHAVDELQAYDDLTDKLATVWKDEPDLTVGECLARLTA